jgi:hypothetical protein
MGPELGVANFDYAVYNGAGWSTATLSNPMIIDYRTSDQRASCHPSTCR